MDTISEDISIMALAEDGEVSGISRLNFCLETPLIGFWNLQVVGVSLNGWVYKGEIEESRQKLKDLKDCRFRTIFTMLYDENLKHNLFDSFNVDKLFEVRILSVDPKHRGQGLGKKLFVESEKLAEKLGAKVSFFLLLCFLAMWD